MPTKFYGAGYSGQSPERLLRVAEVLDAIVVDVRFNPASRVQGWNKWALVKMFGGRYRHIGALGNLNYKEKNGAKMQIADIEAGFREVMALSKDVVILLCGCRDSGYCHRTLVLDEFEERCEAVEGYSAMEFGELDWGVEHKHPQMSMELPEASWQDKLQKPRPGGFSHLARRFPDSHAPKDLYAPDEYQEVTVDTTPMGQVAQERTVAGVGSYRATVEKWRNMKDKIHKLFNDMEEDFSRGDENKGGSENGK